jgi:hypothetical protein
MPRTLEVTRLNPSRAPRPSSVPYAIDLPANIEQEIDDKCASYWLPGCDVALQVSSYLRTEGNQISARRRMAARLSRGAPCRTQSVALGIGHCDCVAVSLLDQEGSEWIHVYLVWPDLAIYATVSGAPFDVAGRAGQWALEALRSIRPVHRVTSRSVSQLASRDTPVDPAPSLVTAPYEALTVDGDATPEAPFLPGNARR